LDFPGYFFCLPLILEVGIVRHFPHFFFHFSLQLVQLPFDFILYSWFHWLFSSPGFSILDTQNDAVSSERLFLSFEVNIREFPIPVCSKPRILRSSPYGPLGLMAIDEVPRAFLSGPELFQTEHQPF